MMNLLLLSNSTNAGEEYLGWTHEILKNFFEKHSIKKCLFFPYAGVTVQWDDYISKVSKVFGELGCEIVSIHNEKDPKRAIEETDAIVVGGGNTFRLVEVMQKTNQLEMIREQVLKGKPYIGWSAGSNITCPTLCTTNDMPIIEPASFKTLNLIPFQINPHYLDANPEGHGGETREQRILEFLEINTSTIVAGLREATAFLLQDNELKLVGNRSLRLFEYGKEPRELDNNQNLNFLLNLNA